MSVLQNISGALDGHLSSMAGLPDVAWPNSDYQPAEGTLFLSVLLASGNVENINLGYLEEHVGNYEVRVVAPAGQFKAEAEAMADTVADHFIANRELTYNGVTVKIISAQFGFGFTAGAWYQIPVAIDYKAYIQR